MPSFHMDIRRESLSLAGFVAFGWWGILKAPWNLPLFSERYGDEKFWPLGFGWRWKIRRIKNFNET